MKIIVTGLSGFVGQNLKSYLTKDFDIKGISRNAILPNEISYQELSTEIFDKSTATIHLAGKAHDLKNVSKDKEYFEVNTELTKTLFQQFLKSGCPIFIYMSSVKAAADTVETILTEDLLPTPITAYGANQN